MIASVPLRVVAAEGAKRTVTVRDCPGERLYEPPPLVIEKSVPEIVMFPLSVPVELDWLVIVTVVSRDCPTATLPKLIDVGLTLMLTTAVPVPLRDTLMVLAWLVALCSTISVPDRLVAALGAKRTVTVRD